MGVTGWADAGGYTITLKVEFAPAISSDAGAIWDVGVWDTDEWGALTTWVDISSDVRLVRTRKGRQRETNRIEVGTAEIVLDNRSGNYSPENTAGLYTAGGITGIRPWRPFRVTVTDDSAGSTFSVFYGYAISWQETYGGPGDNDNVMTVSLVDELAKISGYNSLAVAAVGGGEDAAFRIARILTNAGNTAPTSLWVDPGFLASSMQDTTLSSNALTEIYLTCDSDAGIFYADVDGTLTYEGKYFRFYDSRSTTATATFSDAIPDQSYSDIGMSYDGDLVVNIASYAMVGGTAQTFADASSRALYGDRKAVRTDLICETDAQALSLATWEVVRRSVPELRCEYVTVKPRGSVGQFFVVFAVGISDRVTVIRTPVGGYSFSRDVFIEGVEHTVTPDDWVTTFRFGSATAYDLLGDPVWDSGLWDTARWVF